MEQAIPDGKDWIPSIEEAVARSGDLTDGAIRSELGPMLRANAATWRALLGRTALVDQAPPVTDGEPPVWSALEHGCHVRNTHQEIGDRLRTLLSKRKPKVSDWDQTRAAARGDYLAQDPSQVAYALALAAGKVADMVDRIKPDQWDRAGARPDGTSMTVERLVRLLLHDVMARAAAAEAGYEALTADDEPDEPDDLDGIDTTELDDDDLGGTDAIESDGDAP